jgi:beta-glucosidase
MIARKRTSRFSIGLFLMGLLLAAPHHTGSQTLPLNQGVHPPATSIGKRVSDLLKKMTLEEKVAQLRCTIKKVEWGENIDVSGLGGAGPVLRSSTASMAAAKANAIQELARTRTRLGIPVLIHDEGLHGLVANGAASFPQAIGLAATWDPELVGNVARATAREARSRGIRQLLSPVVNVVHDVRWGRVEETYGEDPYLQSRLGVAFCSALESEGVIATPKHFVANSGDGGRDSYPVHSSQRELREVYFPPFEACVREAGARSIMASYNSLDGIPASANRWLLTDVLRGEWGFTGFVVSDYESVEWIADKHVAAANWKEAAARALMSGLDVELPEADAFGTPLVQALREGLASEAAVDSAVGRVLRAKFELGLFENPFVDTLAAAHLSDCAEHRALARVAAQKAMVLLKNQDGVLPLSKKIRSVAVLGPMSDSVELGDYSGYGTKVVTLLEGVRSALPPSVDVRHHRGCALGFTALPPVPFWNLVPPEAKPGEHGLRGEYFANRSLGGTPAFVRRDTSILFEWAMGSPDPSLPRDGFSIRWTGALRPDVTGEYSLGAATDDGVRVWLDGKLLIDSWYERGALLDRVTMRLEAGKSYDLKIEYYENSGWSYAALVWQLRSGPDPRITEAAELARRSDVAIVAVGITEGEGYDRSSLALPGAQEELISAVAATGTPTVVVLITGSAVTMSPWLDRVAAVLQAWYAGEEGGAAMADVLFGDANPGGKLPLTFPQAVGQVPLFYNHRPTGRADVYADLSGDPQFAFGHGLSYTTFRYSDLTIAPKGALGRDGTIDVGARVTNTGSRSGDEVVQLYLRDAVGWVTRPVKELRGFRRVTLAPGESATVRFTLSRRDLEFLDENLRPVLEPGDVTVMVGSSSADIRLTGSLTIPSGG